MIQMPVHKHIILRIEVNRPPGKDQMDFMKDWFLELIKNLDMKLCAGPLQAYVDAPGNEGYTGVAIIEFSHISVHVWENSYPALMEIDVYSCKPLDVGVVIKSLEVFDPVKIEYVLLDREHTITLLDKGEYDV